MLFFHLPIIRHLRYFWIKRKNSFYEKTLKQMCKDFGPGSRWNDNPGGKEFYQKNNMELYAYYSMLDDIWNGYD